MDRGELISNILTPREHNVYLGGTAESTPKTVEEWDTPEGVLQGRISLDQAREGREKIGHITSFPLDLFFRLYGNTGITLPPLDQHGITISNPQIVEIDKETGEIIRELPLEDQKKYLDRYKEIIPDGPPDRAEGNSPSSAESKR